MIRWTPALLLVACASDPTPVADPLFAPGRSAGRVARHSSSIAVSPDGATVYVVNADADCVSIVDVRARRLLHEVALGPTPPEPDLEGRYDPRVGPRALALSPGARRLYVTGQRSGELSIVALDTLSVARVAVCAEPVGVLVSPDERSVYVACAMDAAVLRVDAARRAVTARVSTPWKPWSLAWSGDASVLYVGHLLGPGVSALDASPLRVRETWRLDPRPRSADARVPNGEARGLYDVVVRPGNTRELWLPHALLATETAQRPRGSSGDALELDFETTVFPAVTVLGADGRRAAQMSVASMGVAPAQRRPLGMQHVVSGPHALDFTPDGRWALVADANSDDVMVIDADRRVEAAQGLVRPIGGAMPEGVVVSPDGTRAYVDLRNTATLGVLALTEGVDGLQTTVDGEPIARLRRDPMPANLRAGQRMFFSANSGETPITQNSWVACASCHIEGRSDAVTWRFKPGPRDTPSNAGGSLGTGPLLRTALRRTVEDYWRTITIEQGGDGAAFRDDPTLRPRLTALQDFVNLAIPFPVPPTTDAAIVARGREVFERPSVGCATCHVGPRLTDSDQGSAERPRLYDVGSCNLDPRWPDRAHTTDDEAPREACLFDTPSLRGIADSAPYLHDGSAATLRDVLLRTRGRMGHIEGLDASELDALVEYMRSL